MSVWCSSEIAVEKAVVHFFSPLCIKRLSAGQLLPPLYDIMNPQKNMHSKWPLAEDKSKD